MLSSLAAATRTLLTAAFLLAAPVLAAPLLAAPLPAVAAPEIIVDARGVLVVGLDSGGMTAGNLPRRQAREILRINALDPSLLSSSSEPGTDLPPLLGSFRIEAGGLRFQPRFPPAPGLVLDIRFDGAAWDRLSGRTGSEPTADAARRYLVPEPSRPSVARVTRVSPSGPVPENLLRLYVHFSEPMSSRHVLEHVTLLDEHGEPVPVAFVDVPGGLWDPDRRRLTLFVHPGRVKRGVGPNQALGPVLEAGKRMTLRIDAEARDAHGRPLAETFEATLEVGAADRSSPDPSSWRLLTPTGPRTPLLVELDQPADTALLARLLRIEDGRGEPVDAAVLVAGDGRRVRFEPRHAWRPGPHRLIVPQALEDPSGNRVDRLFEEAPSEHDAAPGAPVKLVFDINFSG